MSVALAVPMVPFAAPIQKWSPLPVPFHQAVSKARWIAESDPRVSVAVAKRDVVVSTFVSAPHARSGGMTLGIRYMASSRGGLELVASAVVDLFAGELLSLAIFEPVAGGENW